MKRVGYEKVMQKEMGKNVSFTEEEWDELIKRLVVCKNKAIFELKGGGTFMVSL